MNYQKTKSVKNEHTKIIRKLIFNYEEKMKMIIKNIPKHSLVKKYVFIGYTLGKRKVLK